MGRKSKTITVRYGLFDNPNKRGIQKAIEKWGGKGYQLVARNEIKAGCIAKWFTLGWARGKTELTFVQQDD